jgi:hypothetical protein
MLFVDGVDVAGQDRVDAVAFGEGGGEVIDGVLAVQCSVTSTIGRRDGVLCPEDDRWYPTASVETSLMAKPRSVASRSTSRRMPRPSG